MSFKQRHLEESGLLISTLVLSPIIAIITQELFFHGSTLFTGRRIAEHTTKKEFLDSIMKDKSIGKIDPKFGAKGFTTDAFSRYKKTSGGKQAFNNAKGHIYFTSGKLIPNLIQRAYYTTVLSSKSKSHDVGLKELIALGLWYTLTDPIFNTSKTKTLFLDLPDDQKKLDKMYKSDPNSGQSNFAFRSDRSKKVYSSRYRLLYNIIKTNFLKASKNIKI